MQITAAVARERFGAFTIERVELTDPRPDELLVRIVASGMCQTDQHARDGYYNTPLSGGVRPRGRGHRRGGGDGVTKFAPGDHVVISFPWCGTCPNCRRQMESHCQRNLRPQDERHARRRLDADEPGRRAGLQRVLPAIVVCDLRDRQRALRREGAQRCAARTARAVRLQRADRRRRGAQLDAAAGRATRSPCSASARSASPA